MTDLPDTFVQICAFAGLSPEEAQEKWDAFELGAARDFLSYLVTDAGLSSQSIDKLREQLGSSDSGDASSMWELLEPVFVSDAQKLAAKEKMSKIYVVAMGKMYEDMSNKMSIDTKQVVNSYVEAKR